MRPPQSRLRAFGSFGGKLDREFAERIVDNVMRGYAASGDEAASRRKAAARWEPPEKVAR